MAHVVSSPQTTINDCFTGTTGHMNPPLNPHAILCLVLHSFVLPELEGKNPSICLLRFLRPPPLTLPASGTHSRAELSADQSWCQTIDPDFIGGQFKGKILTEAYKSGLADVVGTQTLVRWTRRNGGQMTNKGSAKVRMVGSCGSDPCELGPKSRHYYY